MAVGGWRWEGVICNKRNNLFVLKKPLPQRGMDCKGTRTISSPVTAQPAADLATLWSKCGRHGLCGGSKSSEIHSSSHICQVN